jgi:hypothetical protein
MVTDWEGNLIKEGDILCIYQFRDNVIPKSTFKFVMEDFKNNITEEKGVKPSQEVVISKYIWKKLKEVEVVRVSEMNNNLFFMEKDSEHTYFTDISFIYTYDSNTLAVCIRGKSDNEERFYLNHFKVN